MGDRIRPRMGDGERIELDVEELRQELRDGTRNAAEIGKVPELAGSDLDQLFEIFAEPGRIVSVPPGRELVVTDDSVAQDLHVSEEKWRGRDLGGPPRLSSHLRAWFRRGQRVHGA